jgi:hypothetical protein
MLKSITPSIADYPTSWPQAELVPFIAWWLITVQETVFSEMSRGRRSRRTDVEVVDTGNC